MRPFSSGLLPLAHSLRRAARHGLALCGSLGTALALAQTPVADEGLQLQPSSLLGETLSAEQRRQAPVFLHETHAPNVAWSPSVLLIRGGLSVAAAASATGIP